MDDETPGALAPGHIIGRYCVEHQLDRGGFGIIYLAMDRALGRRVAIKEYYPRDVAERADIGDVVARIGEEEEFDWGLRSFRKEAERLGQVQHRNIVRVHSYEEQGGTGYIVMEWVEGVSLSQRLKRQTTLPEADIRQLILPIMDGLAAVHDEGLLYLDVSPKNIMLTPDGRSVLVDFGSVRPIETAATGDATIMLTPSYAALEQHTEAVQSPATDIYCLGAVLHHCVTGHPPWHPTKRVEDDRMPRVSDSEQRSSYGSSLLRMIDAALAVRPDDRPQSIAEWQRMGAGSDGERGDGDRHSGSDEDATVSRAGSRRIDKPPTGAAGDPTGIVVEMALLRRATGGRLRSYRVPNQSRAERLQAIRKAIARGELIVNGFNRWRLRESPNGGAHWTFTDPGQTVDALAIERSLAKREAGQVAVLAANEVNAHDILAALEEGTDRPDVLFACRDWSRHATGSAELLQLIRLAKQRRILIHMIIAFGSRSPPNDDLFDEARHRWALQRDYAAPPVTTSKIERRFGECLHAAGLDPVPQVPVAGYFLDFGVRGMVNGLPMRLDVEVDGRHWHEELPGRSKPSDLRRDCVVRSLGWRPVRMWSDAIERDQEACVERVRRELSSPVPLGRPSDVEEELQ